VRGAGRLSIDEHAKSRGPDEVRPGVAAPPAFMFRWWVQFVGHIPFVAVPIVAMISRPTGGSSRDAGGTSAAASA